ncbi:MAG: sigma-70 family RNA polymerase sigma factor [Isosphaeraceae bacterium]
MDDIDLAELISRARGGDAAAFSDIVRRFEPELRVVVRARLPRDLRPRFDSLDILQSLWKSVLRKDGAELPRFENSRHLVGFLAGVARNKIYEQHRRRTQTQKYDLSREEQLVVRRGGRDQLREVPSPDPSPSETVQERDRLSQLLRGRSILERQVVNLRRSGLTYEEIAENLGLHEAAVRRIVDALRKRLEERRWQ